MQNNVFGLYERRSSSKVIQQYVLSNTLAYSFKKGVLFILRYSLNNSRNPTFRKCQNQAKGFLSFLFPLNFFSVIEIGMFCKTNRENSCFNQISQVNPADLAQQQQHTRNQMGRSPGHTTDFKNCTYTPPQPVLIIISLSKVNA